MASLIMRDIDCLGYFVIDWKQRRFAMAGNGLKVEKSAVKTKESLFCSKCGVGIGKDDQVAVSEDGSIYCYKNCCAYGIPEEQVIILRNIYVCEIFCSNCGSLVSKKRREMDINSRVFCSDDCKSDFYCGVCVCSRCGIEI